MQINRYLIINLIIFNFYFQQIIKTPLFKVFDMLDVRKLQNIRTFIKMDTNEILGLRLEVQVIRVCFALDFCSYWRSS